MKYLLGIDIGTSGTKTALFDLGGTPVASETVGYPLYQPQNGYAEQEPLDWWNACVDGIKSVLTSAGATGADIAGIGLSGQMHGLVMLDKDGKVLRKSIIWCDQRTAAQCEKMSSIIGEKRIIEITANPPMTGFTAAKIMWVRENEPEIYEKCAHILLPKDYIRYMLTGEFATEVSDASGMQLMDVKNRCWSDEMLTKLGIEKSLLAAMYESPDLTGRVCRSAAELTGLSCGTPVAGGAGDNAAAAVGTGIVRSGSAFNTIGSSAVIYAVTDELQLDMRGRVHSLCASVPGKWTLMSCTQGAGISLKWLRDTCCGDLIVQAKNEGVSAYSLMDSLAARVPAGAGRLIFLPYLMGERSPHPDADCRGVFFGLSAKHTQADMIRAVLEGVAFSQKECADVFRELGMELDEITLCGGAASSALWQKILCDVHGCKVSTLAANEGAALGAALLGGVCAGEFGSVEQACSAAVKKNPAVLPDKSETEKYEPFYALYKKLYLSLKDDFKALSASEAGR